MQDMLGRIHEVVGGLMPAENFYIVLYDDLRETLRFLYFADQRDPYVADPGVELDAEEMGTSLTVALLRPGPPLFGPSEDILRQLDVPRDPTHGQDHADRLGVPVPPEGRGPGALGGRGSPPARRHPHQ